MPGVVLYGCREGPWLLAVHRVQAGTVFQGPCSSGWPWRCCSLALAPSSYVTGRPAGGGSNRVGACVLGSWGGWLLYAGLPWVPALPVPTLMLTPPSPTLDIFAEFHLDYLTQTFQPKMEQGGEYLVVQRTAWARVDRCATVVGSGAGPTHTKTLSTKGVLR